MGDTKTSFGTGGGRYALVAAFEGYDTLACSGQTTAMLTAWAATDWATAIGGLRIAGTLEQEIDPWSTELNPMELTLLIAPDDDDTFGVICNQGGAGTESYLEYELNSEFDAALGTAIVRVTDGDQFAATGSVYIGTERIDYTGNAANSLTGCTRGLYHPASTSAGGNVMGKPHKLPSVAEDVAQKPVVTSVARVWIGKQVAVHMHKNSGGVLDLKAESQRIFYGTVESIEDSVDGTTVVRCVSIEERLNRTVLLNDQWSGTIADGITTGGDTTFGFIIRGHSGGSYNNYTSAAYTLTAGTRTVEEIAELLTTWLNADATVGAIATFNVRVISDGRFEITASTVSGGPTPLTNIALYTSKYLLKCFGWTDQPDYVGYDWVSAEENVLQSPDAVLIAIGFAGYDGTGITVATTGEWFNNQSRLPDSVSGNTVAGENWGVVQVGSGLFVARYVSDTSLDALYALPDQSDYMYGGKVEFAIRKDGDPPIEVKQVVMIAGSFEDVIGQLFFSTGTPDYNVADYDVLPEQLGAGIPYEVLGTSFVTSIKALSESTEMGSFNLVIDRPTYLWDAISADLLMRVAWLVWRDGGLLFSTAVSPHASIATHTWTESDKQGSSPSDSLRTVAATTDKALRNCLKIKYNRRALSDETYGSTLEVRFTRSIHDYGERVQTIEARNSYGAEGSESVEALAADIVTKVMPLYGVPLKKMRRPLSLEYYEGVAPGDVAVVTDPHMRDPATGARSITDKPALVVSHSRGFVSPPVGEAEVLYMDLDRAAIYSPTAEVASYAADGANGAFTCTAHAYSSSTEDTDVEHYADNDVITAIERDPDDHAAPDSLDTIVSGTPAANVIKTDDLFAAYDAGKEYYIISRNYGSAVATQASDCYYADTDDGRVADSRSPYVYADSPLGSFTNSAGTELAERHSDEVFADGTPVCTGAASALAYNVNNLANYATAAHGPSMFQAVQAITSESYIPIGQWQFHLGPVEYPGGMTRLLYLAPLIRSTSALFKMYVRCTISRWRPSGATDTTTLFAAPYVQLAFETASITFVTPSVQTMTPASPLVYPQGDGWLTMEAKVEADHVGSGECWGMSKFYLGPLVSI